MMDSSPIVCITGQVGSKLLGSDAFQETDITGVTLPITKHNYLVTRAEDVAPAVREAFYIAKSGRPGPVLIDITKDAQQSTCEFDWEAAAPRHARLSSRSLARQERIRQSPPADSGIQAAAHPGRTRYPRLRRGAGSPGVRRAHLHPRGDDAIGPRRPSGLAFPQSRHDGHARRGLGEQHDSGSRPASGLRHALRRPRHRQPEDLRPQREENPH